MSSTEYYDGKMMEGNIILHSHLSNFFKFDSIVIKGDSKVKGDIIGYNINTPVPISIKHGSQKNTQVHLPTLHSFSKSTDMPEEITAMLEKWLGVTNQNTFISWLNGKSPTKNQQKYKRLYATDIPNWEIVVQWFNNNKEKITKLLIQSMNSSDIPAKYLVWVFKNNKNFQVIDVDKLVDWIVKECKWETGPRNNGSTLRCVNTEGKPIFHMQMKGSGGYNGEYNHNPQFHIHTHWSPTVIIHKGTLE